MSARNVVLLDSHRLDSLSLAEIASHRVEYRGLRVYYQTPIAPVYVPETLLSVGSDPKSARSTVYGCLSGVLYLSPAATARDALERRHDGAGFHRVANTCPWSTAVCRFSCLARSGRGRMDSIGRARINKTILYHAAPRLFGLLLEQDVRKLANRAAKLGLSPAIRPNGTSDLAALREFASMLGAQYGVTVYDYSKSGSAVMAAMLQDPTQVHLTLSWSGENRSDCQQVLRAGGNVSVPFYPDVPTGATFLGAPIIDGDTHDLRIPSFDGHGVVVGLKYKHAAGRHATAAETLRAALAGGFVLPADAAERLAA